MNRFVFLSRTPRCSPRLLTQNLPYNHAFIAIILLTNTPKPPVNTAFVHEWGSRGRRFESSHPDQKKSRKRRVFGTFHVLISHHIFYRSNPKIACNLGKSRSVANTTANTCCYHSKSGGCCLLYCAVEMPSRAPSSVQTTAVVLATSSA